MTMTDNTNSTGPRFLPRLRSRWWTLLLGVSLMGNLLVGGAIVGHGMRGDDGEGPRGRGGPGGFTQLMPRGFFAELPRERRRELLGLLMQHRPDFDSLRQQANATAGELAALIEVEPYDPAAVKTLVDNYVRQGGDFQNRGGAVLLDMLARLSPDERKLLAAELRKPRGFKHD